MRENKKTIAAGVQAVTRGLRVDACRGIHSTLYNSIGTEVFDDKNRIVFLMYVDLCFRACKFANISSYS